MDFNNFEIELTRMAVFWGITELIAFLVTLWMLYLVIKNAIRDGIKESGLVKSWPATRGTRPEEGNREHNLPDMRADR